MAHGTLDRVHRRVLPPLSVLKISPRLSIAPVTPTKLFRKARISTFKVNGNHTSENCCGQIMATARQHIELIKVEGHKQPATEPFTIENNQNELGNILLGLIL